MMNHAPWHARSGQILLNRFQLNRPLGQGGMGEVWLARDQDLDLDIAIKLLHPELAASPAQVEFLKNECRLARRLNHPHIVKVFDFHHDGPTVFISMAWVDGPSYDDWQKQRERSWVDRLRPLVPAAGALAYVHRQNMVHRDVKAGNILIDAAGQPRLTDFGIAGVFRIEADSRRRFSGGSWDVMSPQQREGMPPHPADDIYSFGVLLLDALAPAGQSKNAAVATAEPQRLLASISDLPRALNGLIAGMLSERRADRPDSMATVAATLESALSPAAGHTIPPAETPPSLDSATPPADEVITPQPFARLESRDTPSGKPRSWQAPLLIGILALILVAGGGWLLQYLAHRPLVPEPTATTKSAPATTSPAQTAPPPAEPQPAGNEAAAEKALADWRQARNDLDAAGVSAWAPEKLSAILGKAGAGDDAFLNADYDAASQHYNQAAQDARDLVETAPQVLDKKLEEAQAALVRGESALAQKSFTLALTIDPQNTIARKGLERAEKLAEVMTLMQNGEAHESSGNLALALADYEAALALDPEWAPAQAAVPRVRDQVAMEQFRTHMSIGLAAFHRRSYAEARREINKALTFKPGAPEATDALAQIDTAVRNDRIAVLRRKAETAEAEEKWGQALQHYRETLAMEPALQFAVRGAARAEERLRLEKRVTYYMANPGDLGNAAYLENARQLLDALGQVSPRGPRLQSQIATLERMVQNAQTRVAVELTSDELTEVTIYRVGRLGHFLSRTVELRPGTYTVTGSRDGYKDVRQTIRIRPGQEPVQVVVKCTEKI